MDHIENYISRGNLSDELKLHVVKVLTEMMNSEDPIQKEFAINTLVTQRRVLSYWTGNDPE